MFRLAAKAYQYFEYHFIS